MNQIKKSRYEVLLCNAEKNSLFFQDPETFGRNKIYTPPSDKDRSTPLKKRFSCNSCKFVVVNYE